MPGEIYWAEFADGHLRPVITIARESLNRGNQVQIVPLTSRRVEFRSQFPNCVSFAAGEFGLTKDCVAQAEMLTVLPKEKLRLDKEPLGILDDVRFRDLVRAIGYVIDADCEPI